VAIDSWLGERGGIFNFVGRLTRIRGLFIPLLADPALLTPIKFNPSEKSGRMGGVY
jgi:hypothetical protein